MSRITFWDYGNDGSSEIAAAGAVGMALTYPGRVLLLNKDKAGAGVEAGFSIPGKLQERAESPLEEYGIEALLRLAANQRLRAANFSDYTHPVIKGKLDLVSGCREESVGRSHELGETLQSVYSAAQQAYDLIFTRSRISGDSAFLPSPLHPPASRVISVAVLRQNRLELERFFEETATEQHNLRFADAVVLQHYDSRSHWSASNIRRRFGCKLPLYVIPHSTEFMDAWNNMNIVKFITLHRLMPRRGPVKENMLSGLANLCHGLYSLTSRRTADVRRSEKGA